MGSLLVVSIQCSHKLRLVHVPLDSHRAWHTAYTSLTSVSYTAITSLLWETKLNMTSQTVLLHSVSHTHMELQSRQSLYAGSLVFMIERFAHLMRSITTSFSTWHDSCRSYVPALSFNPLKSLGWHRRPRYYRIVKQEYEAGVSVVI